MIIKKSTKRGQDLISRTNGYQGFELDDVYGNASVFKRRAYNWCLEQYRKDENAENFRITSHNMQQFTVAWDTIHIDNSTGEVLPCRHIETAAHTYDVVG